MVSVAGGDIVEADDVNYANGFYVYSAAEPTNNTTTLSNDLQLSIPAQGRWAISGVYFFRSTAAAGLKIGLVGDGSGVPNGSIRWGIEGSTAMVFGGTTIGIAVSGSSSFYRAAIWGFIDNTGNGAGTVTLQYAQTTSNAGPTGPIAGRWLRAHQIA